MSEQHTCPTCKRTLVCPVCDAGRQQRLTHAQWDEIRGLWNTHVKEPVKRLARITELRKRHIRARLAECGGEFSVLMDWLREIITVINRTPFLLGQNGQGWMVTFDWVTKSEANGVKILEGQYDQNYQGMHEARHGERPPAQENASPSDPRRMNDAQLAAAAKLGSATAARMLRERRNQGAERNIETANKALRLKRERKTTAAEP